MNIDEMQAGREMDALIAEKVMGLDIVRLENGNLIYHVFGLSQFVPFYSTNIAAAWKVVEKLLSLGWSHGLSDGAQRQPQEHCEFYREIEGQPRVFAFGETAPLAICRAALKTIDAPKTNPFINKVAEWVLRILEHQPRFF